MEKIKASYQLNYEIGIFMFRAIDTLNQRACDYFVGENFTGIIDELNKVYEFKRDELLCGFEKEYENAYGCYDKKGIDYLFKIFHENFKINMEGGL